MRNSIATRMILAVGILCMGAGLAVAQGMPGPGMQMQGGMAQQAKPQPALERAFGLPGMQGRWWTYPRVVELLKLTDEQQKAMDGILMEHREKLIDLRASLQKAELKMEELVGDEHPDENAIVAQIDKVAQARAELEKANARFLLAVWSKLTPEQRVTVKETREGRGMRGNWGDGGMRRPMMHNRPYGAQPAPDAAPPAKQ